MFQIELLSGGVFWVYAVYPHLQRTVLESEGEAWERYWRLTPAIFNPAM